MALYIGNQKVAPTMLPSSGGVSIPLEVSSNGVLQKPTSSFTWSLPSTATKINSTPLRNAFYECSGLISVDLSSLTTVSGVNAMDTAFYRCHSLQSVNLSNLTTISGRAALSNTFGYCVSLTSVDLSSLTTVSGESCMSGVFSGSTSLTTLSFPSLTSTSFGSYTNQFNNMLLGVTGCTVHFPSNLQSVIGSWSSVTSGFGGTNTTVLFDLSATT